MYARLVFRLLANIPPMLKDGEEAEHVLTY